MKKVFCVLSLVLLLGFSLSCQKQAEVEEAAPAVSAGAACVPVEE